MKLWQGLRRHGGEEKRRPSHSLALQSEPAKTGKSSSRNNQQQVGGQRHHLPIGAPQKSAGAGDSW